MSVRNLNHKYTAITVVMIALAGFFATTLAANIYRMMKSGAPSVSQAVIGQAETSPPAPDSLAAEIRTYVEQEPAATRDAVTQIYAAYGYAPLWIKSRGKLKDLAESTTMAESQGVDATRLTLLLEDVKKHSAETDVALTREVLRLSTALRTGAVSTEKLGRSWVMPAEDYDPTHGLISALKDGDVATFLAGLPPQDAQYKSLIAAYKTYRSLAAKGGWPAIPGTDELKLDTTDSRLTILRQRLTAEGYTNAHLIEALKLFQARNGLDADGRIGRGTLVALNTPVETRLAQIAANMERRRHTTRNLGDSFVAVNAASATLDLMVDGKSTLRMNVVTGDKRHATPILSAKITGVTLNPRWEIPQSIASKEILPKLKANPRYLAENNMTIVDGVAANSTGEMIDWSQYSPQSFPMRLRQRPGDDNALGVLKFQMSNPYNIYLHDTPSKKAFARAERHLSHGCVRLGQPITLAAAVLADRNEEFITAEINQGETRTLALKTPLPVHIFYWTAFSEDGVLHFRNDIYNRDLPLAEALTAAK